MDVRTIAVPGPEAVGPLNAYLVLGEETVLIDPGSNVDGSLGELRRTLEEHITIEEIDRILITHPHSDHFGNAAALKEETGAEVLAHGDAAEIVQAYGLHREKQAAFFEGFMERMGVPGSDAAIADNLPPAGDVSVEVDRELEDGEELLDGTLECIHTPGHAPGAVCFRFGDSVFTGDTVLENITPNPLMQVPDDGDVPHNSLDTYLDSLRKLESLEPEKGLPGHGPPVEHLERRIGQILAHHEERKEDVYQILAAPKTPFDVMQELFPGIDRDKYFFGMSEAFGHLELLVEEGRVEKRENDHIVYSRS